MFVVIEKIKYDTRTHVFGPFDYKTGAEHWVANQKLEQKQRNKALDKRKYLPRTWSIKPVRPI